MGLSFWRGLHTPVPKDLPRIAIIGAGPAGISASAVLSAAQIEHCIFDKAVFPRDKICGDAVALSAFDGLEEYLPGLKCALKAHAQFHVLDKIRFFREGFTKPITLLLAGEAGKTGFTMPRFEMDNLLIAQMNPRFAHLYQGVSIQSLQASNLGITLKLADDAAEPLHFCLVIVCSGSSSALYRYFDVGTKRLTALRIILDMDLCLDRAAADLFYVNQLLPHYIWTFPVAGGKTNVGLCGGGIGVNRAEILREFLRKHAAFAGKSFEDSAVQSLRFSYQSIPVSANIAYDKLTRDGIIVAGDAAHLAHTFTGGGIATALRSGIAAGRQAVQATRNGVYSKRVLKGYGKKLKTQMRSEQILDFFLQKVFSSRLTLRIIFQFFSGATFLNIAHAFRPSNLRRLIFARSRHNST